MTLSTHIITGAAIWLATKNPYIAIPLSFFSHQVLDQWCLYHPNHLLKLDSWGKWLLLVIGILALAGLFLLTQNPTAWFYGIAIAWLGFDLQWVLRWMKLDVYKIHDLFGRRFQFYCTWRLTLIELFVVVYGLFVIWLIRH